jgi:hypothetical protein
MSFEEKLTRFRNDLRIRRLRKKCYDALDKLAEGNRMLEEVNAEVREMIKK